MQIYWQVFIFSLIGSLASWSVAVFLIGGQKTAKLIASYTTPFAAGAFLATVFFDLLPEGLNQAKASQVLTSVLIGLLIFFYLERFLRWFHFHNHKDNENNMSTVTLVIIGDSLHNILDGVAIATAFLLSAPVGIITTLAVVAHEIPQTISNFGLMISKGLSRKNTILLNLLNSMMTVPAAVFTFWLGSNNKLPLGVLLGLSAGLLLYIATADIIPTIHDETDKKPLRDIRPLLLILGILAVLFAISLSNRFMVA